VKEAGPGIQRVFSDTSKRLLLEALIFALSIPLVVTALFSLTIFGFTSRQYVSLLLSIVVIVIPILVIVMIVYFALQSRLLRHVMTWYAKDRDPQNQGDRDLALRLQKELSFISYDHGALVGLAIFLSSVFGVIAFGGYAEFTLPTSVSYIILELLLAVVALFVTVFISQREMRKVLKIFLADCRGFDFHTSASVGKRLAAFSLVILLLTIGIAWIASAYEATDLMMEELEKRGADNISLLARELDPLINEDASQREITQVVEERSLSDDERLVIYNAAGTPVYEYVKGDVGDKAWDDLLESQADEKGNETQSYFQQAGNRDYLVTNASLQENRGWTIVRADKPLLGFTALGRMSPTMFLILIIGLGTAAFLTLLLSHNISDPLKRLVQICRRVGTGDLTVEVPVDSLDDIGELSTSYDEMLESLRDISEGLLTTSGEVSEGADNIAAVSEDLMAAIEELNALVQELSGQIAHEVDQIRSVEEIMEGVAETISTSQAKASQSSEISLDTEKLVLQGREHAKEAVEKISEFKGMLDESMEAIWSLGESSKKIGIIVDIISRIADQTNLLALNAAIEAARVPEHGKGFAVVAEEVRKLAEEAAGSAQSISDLVVVIQDGAEAAIGLMEKGTMGMYVGIETVDRTDESLASISEKVSQMARLAEVIAQVSSQEMEESGKLAESLKNMETQIESNMGSYEEIGASTEQQTTSTQELSNTAEKLAEIAHKLQEMVAHFRT
jgi:methyl-accepting chemotaxis protein